MEVEVEVEVALEYLVVLEVVQVNVEVVHIQLYLEEQVTHHQLVHRKVMTEVLLVLQVE